MTHDYAASWVLSRARFDQELVGLTSEQLRFRLYPGSLTIGEMGLHVAGLEVWYISQIESGAASKELRRIARCATDGVVNELPFPFDASEISPQFVSETLHTAADRVKGVIYQPAASQLERELKSALGPIITGAGALTRLGFHPAYHQGQAYQIRHAPEFPS